jgi:hypothetical protein
MTKSNFEGEGIIKEMILRKRRIFIITRKNHDRCFINRVKYIYI